MIKSPSEYFEKNVSLTYNTSIFQSTKLENSVLDERSKIMGPNLYTLDQEIN
jgi:hypothetical protein